MALSRREQEILAQIEDELTPKEAGRAAALNAGPARRCHDGARRILTSSSHASPSTLTGWESQPTKSAGATLSMPPEYQTGNRCDVDSGDRDSLRAVLIQRGEQARRG
jgi:hypothetical protein